MAHIHSFPAVANGSARILILGSMPGRASLEANQYYAHPRNAFWPIVSELLGVAPRAPYAARTRALKSAGIALWDVLQSCKRQGSLDAMIRSETQAINDFQRFFRSHRHITRIYFNGATAETIFTRLVLPALDKFSASQTRLPSTSPAHAAMSLAEKREAWQVIMQREKLAPLPGIR